MIAVLTCPRPGDVSYLDGLLELLARDVPKEQLLVVHDEKGWREMPPNNRGAAWKALEAAARVGADLLFLEDDVRPRSPYCLRIAVDYPVPPVAAFSALYTPPEAPQIGIRPAAGFKHPQALKIPGRSLDWLIAFADHQFALWASIVGFGPALAAAGAAAGWLYEQLPHSLFDHIGVVSAARPSRH